MGDHVTGVTVAKRPTKKGTEYMLIEVWSTLTNDVAVAKVKENIDSILAKFKGQYAPWGKILKPEKS